MIAGFSVLEFHNQQVMSSGVRVVRSFADLEAHINAYLCEPHLERDKRAYTAAQECGLQGGRAAARVAATFASWVSIGSQADRGRDLALCR